MERVRQRLLDESAGIKASEEAKKQRELKKFGKKVQVEKQLERQKSKKELNERIKGLKRSESMLCMFHSPTKRTPSTANHMCVWLILAPSC